ncbi:hypothetical protein S40288_11388 [Stachybotrys chartarum IBT 40288]|nr:hypothetical protein S40288_11388 [Stachybotrys chartarum IBT 40288]
MVDSKRNYSVDPDVHNTITSLTHARRRNPIPCSCVRTAGTIGDIAPSEGIDSVDGPSDGGYEVRLSADGSKATPAMRNEYLDPMEWTSLMTVFSPAVALIFILTAKLYTADESDSHSKFLGVTAPSFHPRTSTSEKHVSQSTMLFGYYIAVPAPLAAVFKRESETRQ